MMKKKKSKDIFLKTLLKLAVLLSIILVLFSINRILVFFHSGADIDNLLNIGKEFYQEHQPIINWTEGDDFVGIQLNEYHEKQIGDDYLLAWHLLNTSIKNKSADQLAAYFSDSLQNRIETQILLDEDYLIEQVDLQHHIETHLFSYDKQIISFTDKCVRIKKKAFRKLDKQRVYQQETINDLKSS